MKLFTDQSEVRALRTGVTCPFLGMIKCRSMEIPLSLNSILMLIFLAQLWILKSN